MIVLWWLIVGHFLSDYVLQTETIALNKRRRWDAHDLLVAPTKVVSSVPWYWWMTAHALTHGAAVTLATGRVLLGVSETVFHFMIDWGKCEGFYSHKLDQGMHLICKLVWALFSYMEV